MTSLNLVEWRHTFRSKCNSDTKYQKNLSRMSGHWTIACRTQMSNSASLKYAIRWQYFHVQFSLGMIIYIHNLGLISKLNYGEFKCEDRHLILHFKVLMVLLVNYTQRLQSVIPLVEYPCPVLREVLLRFLFFLFLQRYSHIRHLNLLVLPHFID